MQKIQTKTYVKVRLAYRGTVPTDRQSFNIVPGATYHGQDEVGSFSLVPEPPFTVLLELAPGTYSIVEAGRPKVFAEPAPGTTTKVDVGAVRRAWSTPLATITVVLGPPMDLTVVIPAD